MSPYAAVDPDTLKPFASVRVGAVPVDLVSLDKAHTWSENKHYARWPTGTLLPFSGHRVLTRVEITEHNYLKESGLSGDEVRKGCKTQIRFNSYVVAAFFTRTAEAALQKAQHLIPLIHDHPVKLWDEKERADLIGRKVYWYEQPAVVQSIIHGEGAVILVPDGADQFKPAPWSTDVEEDPSVVNAEYLSPHIWWWRD